jgi:hypothetical protein
MRPCGLFAPRFIDSDGTLICGTRARTRMPPGIAPAPLSRIWYRSIRVVFFVDRPHLISLTVTAQTQIAYTMAATTRTPAVSIKISATLKPAIRAFDMGTSPPDLYAVLHFGAAINQFEIRSRGSRNRAQSRRRPQTLQTHEMQRPKKCARAGSATRLNAGSHPTGGRALTAMAGNETVEVRFSSNRSPLFVRLTETVCCAVLATPGVLTTAGNAPANRPTAIATAIIPLNFPSISVSPLCRRVDLSGQVVPLHVG